jgi:hypothetical protein
LKFFLFVHGAIPRHRKRPCRWFGGTNRRPQARSRSQTCARCLRADNNPAVNLHSSCAAARINHACETKSTCSDATGHSVSCTPPSRNPRRPQPRCPARVRAGRKGPCAESYGRPREGHLYLSRPRLAPPRPALQRFKEPLLIVRGRTCLFLYFPQIPTAVPGTVLRDFTWRPCQNYRNGLQYRGV